MKINYFRNRYKTNKQKQANRVVIIAVLKYFIIRKKLAIDFINNLTCHY